MRMSEERPKTSSMKPASIVCIMAAALTRYLFRN